MLPFFRRPSVAHDPTAGPTADTPRAPKAARAPEG